MPRSSGSSELGRSTLASSCRLSIPAIPEWWISLPSRLTMMVKAPSAGGVSRSVSWLSGMLIPHDPRWRPSTRTGVMQPVVQLSPSSSYNGRCRLVQRMRAAGFCAGEVMRLNSACWKSNSLGAVR